MILDELPFATVQEIEPNIVEVIAHKGAEITRQDMDLMEKGLLEKYGGPYCELVNRVNDYSHTHESMVKATNLKNCAAVAILVHGRISEKSAYIHRLYEGNFRVFTNRDKARSWLRERLKQSI
jgi:hypothetical protein